MVNARRTTLAKAAVAILSLCAASSSLVNAVPLDGDISTDLQFDIRQQQQQSPRPGSPPAAAARPRLQNNQSFIDLAIRTIHASQRAAWEQGVTVQAILEWQYPEWSTYEASGPAHFVATEAAARGRRKTTDPQDVVLQALRSVVAQDKNGRLAAYVTADEDPNTGSSLDSASNLESVLLAALQSGEITAPGNTLNPTSPLSSGALLAWDFITNRVMRGAGGIISQRMDQLQYWSDMLYMGPPAMAGYGLYTQSPEALQLAYDQAKLDLAKLTYPEGSGSKTGLMGHIRFENDTWADPAVWLTGQGWTTLGNLRVVAALAQSGEPSRQGATLSNTTASQVVDLLRDTADLLEATHATFDPEESLWHNYVDNSTTFHDISGSLAVAAATYRLATIAPSLSQPAWVQNAEAVYRRVIPHLKPNGQFGDGLQCVNALDFGTPGFTSVEALSFGVLLEAARRGYSKRGPATALVRTIRALGL